MKTLLYKKLDAFTDGISPGNPAGVIYLPQSETLSAAQMQSIARRFTAQGLDNRVNEVAFCTPEGPGIYSLRFYSFNCEVEFCGHATIALAYDIMNKGAGSEKADKLTIRTVSSELQVINDISASGAVFVNAPEPRSIQPAFGWGDISEKLGALTEEIDTQGELSIVNGGLNTAIIPMTSVAAVVRLTPDETALKGFSLNKGFDVTVVFCRDIPKGRNVYRSRVFCPKYGYLEDPATGSGNAALGYHLLFTGIWDGGLLLIEQGQSLDHPNIVKLRASEIEGARRVQMGGNAVVRFEQNVLL